MVEKIIYVDLTFNGEEERRIMRFGILNQVHFQGGLISLMILKLGQELIQWS